MNKRHGKNSALRTMSYVFFLPQEKLLCRKEIGVKVTFINIFFNFSLMSESFKCAAQQTHEVVCVWHKNLHIEAITASLSSAAHGTAGPDIRRSGIYLWWGDQGWSQIGGGGGAVVLYEEMWRPWRPHHTGTGGSLEMAVRFAKQRSHATLHYISLSYEWRGESRTSPLWVHWNKHFLHLFWFNEYRLACCLIILV